MRPGSRTKVSVPLVLPPTRHPERSAPPIDRVTQRLWRVAEEPVLSVAEGTSAVLIFPMLLGAFQPPSPMTGYCDTHWMVTGTSFAAAENVNVGAGHSKMPASSWFSAPGVKP